MHLTLTTAALAGAAAATCLVTSLTAGGATAATAGYTVAPGGTVKAVQSGSLTFVDQTSTSKPKLVCTGFSGSGSTKKGAHTFVKATYPGKPTGLNAAGSLTKETLSGCTNSVVGKVTVTPSATWYLGFSSKSSTGGKGYLYNVTSKVSAASGACTFVATGAVYGSYANSTGIFSGTTQPGLVLSKVTGSACSVVGVKNGDKAYLSGKVKLTPKQTIK